MLPQIRFSFVEGAHFHENNEDRLIDKQASGPHTNTLGREIKSLIKMMDFELMAYTWRILIWRVKVI